MKIEIHHYHHYPELKDMSQQLEDIMREVQEARGVTTSAVTLIEGLRTRIEDLIDTATELETLKAALSTLSQELSDSTDSLAAAVADPGTPPADGENEAPQA